MDLNVESLKNWARDNKSLAKTVCLAKAFAECERERVNAYIRPVFESFTFADDEGSPITDPERLYHCEDDDLCATYYAACDAAHRENGFDGPEGHCPALIAEHLLVQAENALLESLGTFIDADLSFSLKLRDKALDLALTSALNA